MFENYLSISTCFPLLKIQAFLTLHVNSYRTRWLGVKRPVIFSLLLFNAENTQRFY